MFLCCVFVLSVSRIRQEFKEWTGQTEKLLEKGCKVKSRADTTQLRMERALETKRVVVQKETLAALESELVAFLAADKQVRSTLLDFSAPDKWKAKKLIAETQVASYRKAMDKFETGIVSKCEMALAAEGL